MENGDSLVQCKGLCPPSLVLQSVQSPSVRSFLQGHLAHYSSSRSAHRLSLSDDCSLVSLPTLGQPMLCLSLPLFDSLSFCFSALLLPLPDLYFAAFSYPSSPIGT